MGINKWLAREQLKKQIEIYLLGRPFEPGEEYAG